MTSDASAQGPFVVAPPDYAESALEPHIDAVTMALHHDKHHTAYVQKANEAVKEHPEIAKRSPMEILANLNKVPDAIRSTLRNNLGGHVNHTMFWQVMGPDGGKPAGEVLSAIERDFGGFAKMMETFNEAATKLFGSGWVFVIVDGHGKLAIDSRPNQDTPLMEGKRVLFGNDVWEHAYYIKYQNRRPDYLKAWWNVVNWKKIAERYAAAHTGTLTV